MLRKAAFANIHVAVFRFVAGILLFTSAAPAFEPPVPFLAVAPQNYPTYDITPPSGVPGREYNILVLSHEPTRKEITEKAQLVAPGDIAVSGAKANSSASLTAKISIPKDTPIGKYRFLLKDKDGTGATIIGVADFEVTAIGPGPFPTATPEVDVMWGVMAKNVAHDNFGRYIANNYYGIQIVIGNNSGFDLQIAGIGFQLPPCEPPCK
jgi:hypothetical protein